jgi:hypothetical protein
MRCHAFNAQVDRELVVITRAVGGLVERDQPIRVLVVNPVGEDLPDLRPQELCVAREKEAALRVDLSQARVRTRS